MNVRQKLLQVVYPVWSLFAKVTGRHTMYATNDHDTMPVKSFYDLSFSTVHGDVVSMKTFEGKKVLLVNTASECVYTTQYSGLQELYDKYMDRLIVIAFPSNEFKDQEKGSDADIAGFCSGNFGVTFPVASKSKVRKREGQHPVFQWLTQADLNGWNNQQPVWNFSKYLVSENGTLTHVFGPPDAPVGKEILAAIQK